jgi:hypothetical protein
MKYVRPTSEEDLPFLVERMRPEDVQEIKAGRGVEPLPALLYGLRTADICYTLGNEENPYVGIVGVSKTYVPGAGGVWMLCTEDLVKHQFKFLRGCLQSGVLEEFHDRYPVLWNCVDERNTQHIKWLTWLGFKFIMRHPYYGVEQRPFLEFVRIS